MANELGLYALIRNILAKSMVMEGRFHTIQDGREMNSANFGEIEKDVFNGYIAPKRYPCVLMLPPTETEAVNDKGWSTYELNMYFLTLFGRTGDNDIKWPDLQTNTSVHTIEMDWKDMRECAAAFRSVFRDVTRKPPITNSIQEYAGSPATYRRVTAKGVDNVNGVGVTFYIRLFNGICSNADYADLNIVIPDLNPHSLHKQ